MNLFEYMISENQAKFDKILKILGAYNVFIACHNTPLEIVSEQFFFSYFSHVTKPKCSISFHLFPEVSKQTPISPETRV